MEFRGRPPGYERIEINDGVLFGVGWWQYQGPVTRFTSRFYKRVLSGHRLHSVRDGYTATKLREAGIANVVNTGCPSMWSLDGMVSNRQMLRTEDCLLMLTDYYTNPKRTKHWSACCCGTSKEPFSTSRRVRATSSTCAHCPPTGTTVSASRY
ncbi:MAG: polysaccharide pyruvyl transferase family protein [Paludibaculum sp.]